MLRYGGSDITRLLHWLLQQVRKQDLFACSIDQLLIHTYYRRFLFATAKSEKCNLLKRNTTITEISGCLESL